MSITSTRATALDVCYSVYGECPVSSDVVDNYYETNAPTSRSVIGDIHRMSRQLSAVDVPRPLAMVCTLFRLRPPRSDDALFHALRVWTDILDICENESFDGHRKAIVEHTLNILLLPGIHCEGPTWHWAPSSTDSLVNTHGSPILPSHPQPFLSPSLPIPGTSLAFPSPLHFKLRIITRLSFNEQGLVTHHRDIWDIKDVMGLLPGMSLAQWIGTRIAATGLSYLSKFFPRSKSESYPEYTTPHSLEVVDLEHGDSSWLSNSQKTQRMRSDKEEIGG
ncbi:hypothetical protein GALMADRAFT_205854 [Galerina marginata CBS 339.88]|uniref:Uncharacterized protein n=1 Tax=Galerina marginata (strain CBS 339.88) TaxID=685588 RepID=A0A067TLS0_GALM3|nr:hypothetical protein GALMADRAFT_205854 [Galerina marginata CBS 339.88]